MMSHRYLVALVDAGGNVPPELSAVRQSGRARPRRDRAHRRFRGV